MPRPAGGVPSDATGCLEGARPEHPRRRPASARLRPRTLPRGATRSRGEADVLPSGNAPLSAPRVAMSSHRSASAACPCNAWIQPPITATAGYRSSSASSPKRSSQASTVLIRPLSYAGRASEATRRATRALSPEASACSRPDSGSPFSSYQSGCPAVELRHELGLGLGQLSREQVVKQVVIAVPLAVPVERHEEEVGPLDRGELSGGLLALEDPVAERPRHPSQHGRPPEERQMLG